MLNPFPFSHQTMPPEVRQIRDQLREVAGEVRLLHASLDRAAPAIPGPAGNGAMVEPTAPASALGQDVARADVQAETGSSVQSSPAHESGALAHDPETPAATTRGQARDPESSSPAAPRLQASLPAMPAVPDITPALYEFVRAATRNQELVMQMLQQVTAGYTRQEREIERLSRDLKMYYSQFRNAIA